MLTSSVIDDRPGYVVEELGGFQDAKDVINNLRLKTPTKVGEYWYRIC